MAVPKLVEPEDFLRFAETHEGRTELHDGEIVSMAGGSITHASLSSRAHGILYRLGRASKCSGHMDLMVGVNVRNVVIPDAVVLCGPPQTWPENPNVVTNPTLIVEVLSPSTENFDRGRKAMLYRSLPSLQMLLLVSQEQPEVEVYTRIEANRWQYEVFREGAEIPLPVLDGALPLGELYDGIEFETGENERGE